MLINELTIYEVRHMLGEAASRAEAKSMLDALQSCSETYKGDTNNIPFEEWNDLVCFAVDRANQ